MTKRETMQTRFISVCVDRVLADIKHTFDAKTEKIHYSYLLFNI